MASAIEQSVVKKTKNEVRFLKEPKPTDPFKPRHNRKETKESLVVFTDWASI